MKQHVSRFWKEYIVAVIIILLSGLFMKVDMVEFLRSVTGYVVAESTAAIIVSYSYLFLIVLGPLLLIGMIGHNHYSAKVEYKNARDFHKVKHSSVDHSLHHFLHEDSHNHIKEYNAKEKHLHESRNKANNLKGSELLTYPHAMDHVMLKQHIKNKLVQGHTRTAIMAELANNNWDQNKVGLAFEDVSLTASEAEIMLGSFVTRSLVEGNDINSIRQSLVNGGWESQKVDKVINMVMK
ncbi:hypothetical protein HN695_00880 [Candidatus Woesearchaeota archaeon]|jgi:hypothetical protein|nr:hypothetical protein [Candidatus Woesearchaeota archaeon]MBT5272772.1 hypothetical protein [Candidatus Woesearchaeota archaeon]MBT6040384.1 hypothetical protein [Candidatus Woesearchaeota archaeon]MBT6336983.1 hypothetical protein [Candidatus Woesearchaeota archaeon]MBT7926869.1 hypothetical protein [Candidatus Woesearchaeota archaeon]